MKEILIKLNACKSAIDWVGDRDIEQAVNDCERGDWMLWLAKKVGIDLRTLTLAKGLCANTVRHLMKDERSIKAVDIAISFGKGEATLEELNTASNAAAAAADAARAYVYAAADVAALIANEIETANICREVFGKELIEKLKKL